jgi:hypothetical protein
MYQQSISIQQELIPYIKKTIRGLYGEFTNSTFRVIRENNSYVVNVEGSHGEEFNKAVKTINSIVYKLMEINEHRRMKKKIDKERNKKKKQVVAANNIEKYIKQNEIEKEMNKKKKISNTYTYNGEESTNPINCYFGLELDVPS